MTIFMNIHNVPSGCHLFTVAVTSFPIGTPPDEMCYDEVDVVAQHDSSTDDLIGAMSEIDRESYSGNRIIGVIDQSDGYIVWEDPQSERVMP